MKYIYMKYIYSNNGEYPARKAPREFEFCVIVAFERKEERRISCKGSHGTVAARSCRGYRNVLRDLWNLGIVWKRTYCVPSYVERDNCIRTSETRINIGQYGYQSRNVILRYIFRVFTPTPFNFRRYSHLGPVALTVL